MTNRAKRILALSLLLGTAMCIVPPQTYSYAEPNQVRLENPYGETEPNYVSYDQREITGHCWGFIWEERAVDLTRLACQFLGLACLTGIRVVLAWNRGYSAAPASSSTSNRA